MCVCVKGILKTSDGHGGIGTSWTHEYFASLRYSLPSRCDGYHDCLDGADERSCSTNNWSSGRDPLDEYKENKKRTMTILLAVGIPAAILVVFVAAVCKASGGGQGSHGSSGHTNMRPVNLQSQPASRGAQPAPARPQPAARYPSVNLSVPVTQSSENLGHTTIGVDPTAPPPYEQVHDPKLPPPPPYDQAVDMTAHVVSSRC